MTIRSRCRNANRQALSPSGLSPMMATRYLKGIWWREVCWQSREGETYLRSFGSLDSKVFYGREMLSRLLRWAVLLFKKKIGNNAAVIHLNSASRKSWSSSLPAFSCTPSSCVTLRALTLHYWARLLAAWAYTVFHLRCHHTWANGSGTWGKLCKQEKV